MVEREEDGGQAAPRSAVVRVPVHGELLDEELVGGGHGEGDCNALVLEQDHAG